jgi:ketosteroid isomerase-like protein
MVEGRLWGVMGAASSGDQPLPADTELRLDHRDFSDFTDPLSPDVTYRVGGDHAFAGTFHGPDEVATHMRQLVDWASDTYDAFKFEDWLVGELSVAALVRVHVHGHAAAYEGRLVLVFGFDPTDTVSEITVFVEDPIAAERFFAR